MRNLQNRKVAGRKQKLFRGIGTRCNGKCCCGKVADYKSTVSHLWSAVLTAPSSKLEKDSRFECERHWNGLQLYPSSRSCLPTTPVRWSCSNGAGSVELKRSSARWIPEGRK